MKYLKRIKKLLALTASAIVLTFLPNANVLTASAEEPVTYCLRYSEDGEEWWYQIGSEWNDEAESHLSSELDEKIKNGDVVVICNGSNKMLTFNVRLSNLTITNGSGTLAMVSVTGGIDNCYFISNSFGSVTGSVANAYVYGGSTANFNSNVGNLYSYKTDPDIGPTIGVTGTVAYYAGEDSNSSFITYGTNFQAGSFRSENGELKTASEKYTQGNSGGPVSSAAQSTNTAQNTTSGSGTSSDDEYDAVPKTGETSFALWLCLAAAVCFGGSLLLRKSK